MQSGAYNPRRYGASAPVASCDDNPRPQDVAVLDKCVRCERKVGVSCYAPARACVRSPTPSKLAREPKRGRLAVLAFRQPVHVEAGQRSGTAPAPDLQGLELVHRLVELAGEVGLVAGYLLEDLDSR